jgi:hypothetical protein
VTQFSAANVRQCYRQLAIVLDNRVCAAHRRRDHPKPQADHGRFTSQEAQDLALVRVFRAAGVLSYEDQREMDRRSGRTR